MISTGDPFEDFNRRDFEEYMWEKSRPICDSCGEYIFEDSYFDLLGTKYCPKCIEECRKYID